MKERNFRNCIDIKKNVFLIIISLCLYSYGFCGFVWICFNKFLVIEYLLKIY